MTAPDQSRNSLARLHKEALAIFMPSIPERQRVEAAQVLADLLRRARQGGFDDGLKRGYETGRAQKFS